MTITNCICHFFFLWTSFSGNYIKAFVEVAKKDTSTGWFYLVFASVQTLLWCDSLSVARKDTLGTSEYSVQEQRVLGFSLQHESFLPHKFPSFVLAKGDTLSPLGLEDLQTDNSVQTTLENITLREQPQGWDQGFEKGSFSRFPSALHPEQSLPDNTEISFFLWIKPPWQEKYANAICGSPVKGYSRRLSFLCLALRQTIYPLTWSPAFQFNIFHCSDSQLPGPATASKRGSFSRN